MRPHRLGRRRAPRPAFPFLFGGAFIEAERISVDATLACQFPFLFGGAFIEAARHYGYALRGIISLPFRRGFH